VREKTLDVLPVDLRQLAQELVFESAFAHDPFTVAGDSNSATRLFVESKHGFNSFGEKERVACEGGEAETGVRSGEMVGVRAMRGV
jgi:hypothetical protein